MQAAVKVENIGAAGALMQVIYILSDDSDIKLFFQFGECHMCFIWVSFFELCSSLIVKIQYQSRVSTPGLRCSYILYFMAFPKSISITKSL